MEKISIKCTQCGNEFLKSSYEITRSKKNGQINHFCSNICSCLFNKNINVNVLPKKRIESYNLNPKKCLGCLKKLSYVENIKNNKYCSVACASTHNQKDGGNRVWTDEEKEIHKEKIKNNPYFNGEIDKKTGLYKLCVICGKEIYVRKTRKKQCCSKKCGGEFVKRFGILKGKTGGYREKGGRGKQGRYKGYYCNSSWELAWIIYNTDNNILFERNTVGYQYDYDGRKFKYYPDFKFKNTNHYIEIKGYLDEKNKAKILQFPHQLTVIDKHTIKFFIDYVREKYGDNFIELYE